MSTAGLVVVGAGLAGVRAVEGARRSGFTGPVTLLGTETDAPYDRPPLSKAFLTESAALKYLRTAESLRGELDVTTASIAATSAQEEEVAASEYRALQHQVRELQRLLGKKTLEAEILKEALEVATGPKKQLLRSLSWPKGGSR